MERKKYGVIFWVILRKLHDQKGRRQNPLMRKVLKCLEIVRKHEKYEMMFENFPRVMYILSTSYLHLMK